MKVNNLSVQAIIIKTIIFPLSIFYSSFGITLALKPSVRHQYVFSSTKKGMEVKDAAKQNQGIEFLLKNLSDKRTNEVFAISIKSNIFGSISPTF